MTTSELLKALEDLKARMISVATGGPEIKRVEAAFVVLFMEVETELRVRGIDDRPPYRSLWDWYGRWSQGDLPTYQSRREFVGKVFEPLFRRVRNDPEPTYEPTGWSRVDRTQTEMRSRLAAAKTEEQFQGIGLLGRELLISVAEVVFNAIDHPTLDGTAASKTDAKRMLEAYVRGVRGKRQRICAQIRPSGA